MEIVNRKYVSQKVKAVFFPKEKVKLKKILAFKITYATK